MNPWLAFFLGAWLGVAAIIFALALAGANKK